MSNIKIIMTYSVSLGILPFLIMLSPLGQSIYAASAHTSGYYHGCQMHKFLTLLKDTLINQKKAQVFTQMNL